MRISLKVWLKNAICCNICSMFYSLERFSCQIKKKKVMQKSFVQNDLQIKINIIFLCKKISSTASFYFYYIAAYVVFTIVFTSFVLTKCQSFIYVYSVVGGWIAEKSWKMMSSYKHSKYTVRLGTYIQNTVYTYQVCCRN